MVADAITAAAPSSRAKTQEEIKPLVSLCKAGHLFEVQEWIESGRPVNPPEFPGKGYRHKSPLEVAIEHGFHSLVQVLLRGGAIQEPVGWNSPMSQALGMRRFDIVRLLVDHGFDPRSIDMTAVFDSWDPEIMEYFIDLGADVETGNPLACAFCRRIRTALRVFKKYQDRFETFQEQANIGLRYHCKEGNAKWISLMLWAGADPYAPGSDSYEDEIEPDDEDGLSALGFAALWGHFDVFTMKQVRLDPEHPELKKVLGHAYQEKGAEVAVKLLKLGVDPNDQENGGSSVVQSLLNGMDWTISYDYLTGETQRSGLDTDSSRAKIRAIHILAKYGAKWIPQDNGEVNDARRSLLKLTDDYTVEFVWIMSKYSACSRDDIERLLRTPTMKRHTKDLSPRIRQLVDSWPVDAPTDDRPAKPR